MLLITSNDFFFKMNFFKLFFQEHGVSNGLAQDQDRHSVGPDLGPNCLHRLSAVDKLQARKVLRSVTVTMLIPAYIAHCTRTLFNITSCNYNL